MKTVIYFSVFLLFLFFVPITNAVFGATLKFDPATITTTSGSTFTVKVNVDAGTTTIKGAEAFITFDSNLLQVQTITNGGLFSTFQKDSAPGKAYMAGLADTSANVATGSGTLGIISFSALANGSGTLQFYCDSTQQKGSTIIQNNSTDTNIIDCTANGTASVTIGTGAEITPMATISATPSTLPRTGVFENVIKFAVPGFLLFFIGIATRMLL